VWFGNDVSDLVNFLTEQYPYSVSSIPNGAGAVPRSFWPPCLSIAAYRSLRCMTRLCLNSKSTAEIVSCGHHCGLMDLPQRCVSCFISSGISDVTNTCFLGFGVTINPAGLLLLSRRPLERAEVVDYHKDVISFIKRSYLRAEVCRTNFRLKTMQNNKTEFGIFKSWDF